MHSHRVSSGAEERLCKAGRSEEWVQQRMARPLFCSILYTDPAKTFSVDKVTFFFVDNPLVRRGPQPVGSVLFAHTVLPERTNRHLREREKC